jgi:hypothetical protein
MLEHQLQAKLDLARRIRRGNGSEGRTGADVIRDTEVGVIQDVEKFAAELDFYSLADEKVLVDTQVPLPQARRSEGVTAQVAERGGGRWSRRARVLEL